MFQVDSDDDDEGEEVSEVDLLQVGQLNWKVKEIWIELNSWNDVGHKK